MMFRPFDDTPGRLAAYQYLEEHIADQRVLELGCGEGLGLGRLLALGAREVVGLDGNIDRARAALGRDRDRMRIRPWQPSRLPFSTDSFDLVVVPRARVVADHPSVIGEIRRVLAPGGRLVLRSPNTDHPQITEGLSYGELLDLVEPAFEEVRVIGQCPFVGYSLVELTEEEQEEPEVQLDGGLLAGGAEEVVAYVVICSDPAEQVYSYGVIQVPSSLDTSLDEELEDEELEDEPSDDEPSDDEPEEPEPEPEPEPDDLKSYTDHAGGRLSRWRWPGNSG